jgi:hypothetical protein
LNFAYWIGETLLLLEDQIKSMNSNILLKKEKNEVIDIGAEGAMNGCWDLECEGLLWGEWDAPAHSFSYSIPHARTKQCQQLEQAILLGGGWMKLTGRNG